MQAHPLTTRPGSGLISRDDRYPSEGNGAARLVPRQRRLQPSEHLAWGRGGSLPISEDIGRLLQIDERIVDLDGASHDKAAAYFDALFAAPVRQRRAEPAAVGNRGLVPEEGLRYMTMPNLALLSEVAQRALGFGPPDIAPRDNPGAPLAARRLADMTYALHFEPGRERDILVLRNAGLALDVFFIEYEKLVDRIRATRADLQPAIEAWSADFVRPALEKALELPLGEDGQPQLNGGLYGDIDRTLDRPIEAILADLERRMEETSPAFYAAKLDRFFERISAHREPGIPFLHGIEGAPRNEMKGSEVKNLVTGNLFIRGENWTQLIEYLQMLPAANRGRTMNVHPLMAARDVRRLFPDPTDRMLQRHNWPIDDYWNPPPPTFEVAYFFPASDGIAINEVVWQSHGGPTHVWVAIQNGVHSFSLNRGASWYPTGASASAHLNDARAAAWTRFIRQRRQETGVRPVRPWDPEAMTYSAAVGSR